MIRFLLAVLLLSSTLRAAPFVVEIVDDQTNRGVPLVELRSSSNVCYFTDSAGIAAIDEPGWVNQKVFFFITSFGYEFPADGFGEHGAAVEIKPGGAITLKIKRLNIAQRLYRITGDGIYRDTVLAGRKPPIEQPLLNAQTTGSDSVESAIYKGKIHFFWGDTGKLSYALGNFQTTGAIADLPGSGGLDPSIGINLRYFIDATGFAKHMVPLKEPGAVWVDEPLVLNDDQGRERMITAFSRVKDLGTCLERGLLIYNDDKDIFERLKPIPLNAPLAPGGHAFKVTIDNQPYFYFPRPYPCIRVKADWKSVHRSCGLRGITPPLKQGSRFNNEKTQLDRDNAGHVRFTWKKNTPPLEPLQIDKLLKSGKLEQRTRFPRFLSTSIPKSPSSSTVDRFTGTTIAKNTS